MDERKREIMRQMAGLSVESLLYQALLQELRQIEARPDYR